MTAVQKRPKKRERTKRQRFLPYAFARFGLDFAIRRCELDGSGAITEMDHERHLVELDDDPWERLVVRGEVALRSSVLSQVLPEQERCEPPVELWLVVRCAETRLRRGARVTEAPTRPGSHPFSFELARPECFGTVEVVPFALRARNAEQPAAGFAHAHGARLAGARAWELRVDRRRDPAGRFLDVRYRSFSGDPVLSAYAGNVYSLDHETETPILWINADHEAISAVLNARGATGTRARLREVLYDRISHGVWTQLFLRAVTHLSDGDGETVWEWEDAVLRRLLSRVFPKLRTHAARLAEVRGLVAGGELPHLLGLLDAALQDEDNVSQHMTRLVQEVVERP